MPDGSYRRVTPPPRAPRVRSQEKFLELAAQNAARRLNEVPAPPVAYVEPVTNTRRPRKRQTG